MAKAKKDNMMGAIAQPGKPENDYEAEEGFRTLVRAEELKGKPDLMKRIHAHASKQKKHAEKITSMEQLKARVKKRRAELAGNDEDADD